MKSNTRLRVLRPGDEKFCVTDGPVTTTRAGLEVSNTCPPEMQEMAWMMIANGWISPLAVVKDNELFWEELMN
jgi:hypothetical protein